MLHGEKLWYLSIYSVILGKKGKKTTGYFFSMVARQSKDAERKVSEEGKVKPGEK